MTDTAEKYNNWTEGKVCRAHRAQYEYSCPKYLPLQQSVCGRISVKHKGQESLDLERDRKEGEVRRLVQGGHKGKA